MSHNIEQLPLSGKDIAVPAKLPMILKQFCKAAIRTQPYDLLKWSSSYFRALANGEEPPTKSRLEYPPPSTASGLTLGFLRVLLRQFGNYNKTLPVEAIARRWDCLCLDRRDFQTITTIGKFRRSCQVKRFLAIAVGLLGGNLTETMIMVCQLFSHEPDGGSAMIPLNLFMEIYEYLAGLACDGNEKSSGDEESSTCKDTSTRHTSSMNSQDDTDADVNLDLESMSKDEVNSYSKTDPSTEPVESSSLEREEKLDALIGGDRVAKDTAIGERFCGTKDVSNSDGSVVSGAEKDKRTAGRLNVPGIGARLSAEEVASVAAWMTECALLQEGMVGPRNIRHTECPPLHRRSDS
ncbi:PREDICTED: ropporin-1-like protein isoform X2 [Dinoponera quadriceps]|uniref:Ropporin-1-like protein isoform X2 n=1 Tax=Dinoponera quadriceps TaxID=609295 RepID=A0A6P3XE80_DINQU|nr:PREDICTED: ropporin-1-like protein isoform X2 [Dinoponera quadriceps]